MEPTTHKAFRPSHDYHGTNGGTVIVSMGYLRLWPLLSGDAVLTALEARIGRELHPLARKLASWPWAMETDEGE